MSVCCLCPKSQGAEWLAASESPESLIGVRGFKSYHF